MWWASQFCGKPHRTQSGEASLMSARVIPSPRCRSISAISLAAADDAKALSGNPRHRGQRLGPDCELCLRSGLGVNRRVDSISWGLMPLPGRGRIFVVLMLAANRIM
jgi:hypothetical protein